MLGAVLQQRCFPLRLKVTPPSRCAKSWVRLSLWSYNRWMVTRVCQTALLTPRHLSNVNLCYKGTKFECCCSPRTHSRGGRAGGCHSSDDYPRAKMQMKNMPAPGFCKGGTRSNYSVSLTRNRENGVLCLVGPAECDHRFHRYCPYRIEISVARTQLKAAPGYIIRKV